MSNTTLPLKHIAQLGPTRWSTSTARAVLAAQEASGELLTTFARRHGLQPQRLFWWRKRLSEWSGDGSSAPLFVPAVTVLPRPAPVVRDQPQVTLRLGEIAVEVGDASVVPPEWLAALVQELRR